ncbi:MAG: glycerophosphodiester phosphodiesterase family protein [Capsulimonadales bacterium]|nr:glycerophosphodiester phosphodiesterase family protein [Capsulimonadales bacterium]
MMRNAVEVVCHRGANKVAPENTRAAAQKCIEWGVDYVEVDVRTSKDRVMYLLHDPTVDRTTNGKGPLRELTSAEIDKLDAGSWFHSRFAGEPLPRLEPYLKWIKGKAKIFFDVKDADLPTLIALVRRMKMEKECFFWFGEEARAKEFRRLAPDLPLKINASTVPEIEAAARDYHADIIEIGLKHLTPETLAACHDRKMKLMVIHMPNDPAGFRQIIERGADMVNLDYGDVFLSVLRSTRPR